MPNHTFLSRTQASNAISLDTDLVDDLDFYSLKSISPDFLTCFAEKIFNDIENILSQPWELVPGLFSTYSSNIDLLFFMSVSPVTITRHSTFPRVLAMSQIYELRSIRFHHGMSVPNGWIRALERLYNLVIVS